MKMPPRRGTVRLRDRVTCWLFGHLGTSYHIEDPPGDLRELRFCRRCGRTDP